MPRPGNDNLILDGFTGGDSSGATDRLFLLDPNGPASPTLATRADTDDDTLNDRLRGYFTDGGKTVYISGYDASIGGLPSLDEAIALLPEGPGQVVAPDLVSSSDLIKLADVWPHKVALLQGPANATDSALETLASAVISGTDARGAALFADRATYPGITAGATVNVPWSITVAGLIARNDRLTGNPNIAAGGKFGRSAALGVADLRNDTRRQALSAAQVNSAKVVKGELRSYGFRSLADLTDLPQWRSFAAARLIMAWGHTTASVAEEFDFEQIDGQGKLLHRYEGALKAEAKKLYDLDALFGKTPEEAYSIDATSETVNPLVDIQDGEIKAVTRLKVSEFVEHTLTTIIRPALTAAL